MLNKKIIKKTMINFIKKKQEFKSSNISNNDYDDYMNFIMSFSFNITYKDN